MSNFLTDTQRSLLKDVLNHIIPEDMVMPAAGQIAAGYVESASSTSEITIRVVLDILALTDTTAGSLYGKPFSSISDSLKKPLLKIIEEKSPKLFSDFVTLVYNGYYTNASVIELLGPDARNPQPTGFQISPFNSEIVNNVRKLGTRYRAI